MGKIELYFKAANDSSDSYVDASSVIKYLDSNFPRWRDEIKDPNEWDSLFNYDIHIFQNSWLQTFANNLFDIIDNKEALLCVWNSETCNEFYRLAAIQRLCKINEDKYLPQYIEELKGGKFVLGGWWLPMIDELFDFPSAEKVAIDMYLNSNEESLSITKSMGIEYLSGNITRYWDKYPEDIKNSIICNEDYSLRKNCTPHIWATLSQSQKFLLIHRIIINEYKCVNDILNIYNYLRNIIYRESDNNKSFNFIIYDSHLKMRYDDLKRRIKEGRILAERDMEQLIPRDFYLPQIDYNRLHYRPSEQLSNFDSLTNSPEDTELHKMTERAIRDIEHTLNCTDFNTGFLDYDPNNETIVFNGVCVLGKDDKIVRDHRFSGNQNIVKLVVPRIVEGTGCYAFHNCKNLREIEFAEGIEYIEASAFEGCDSLERVILPSSLTYLGASVFANCVNLKRINFPSHLSAILMNVFEGCTSLTDIDFEMEHIDNPRPFDSRSFVGIDCNKCTIHVPRKLIQIFSKYEHNIFKEFRIDKES